MKWFSCRVRVVCLVEGCGATRYMDAIHLVRAEDYSAALSEAISVGRKHEEEYQNQEGKSVRWRLKQVMSIDELDPSLQPGVEVHSCWVDLPAGEYIDFDEEFSPENSEPENTI